MMLYWQDSGVQFQTLPATQGVISGRERKETESSNRSTDIVLMLVVRGQQGNFELTRLVTRPPTY